MAVIFIAGGWTLLEADQGSKPSEPRQAYNRDRISIKQLTAKTSQAPLDIPSKLTSYAVTLKENNELLLYGSIAVFGILIMGLAIARAKAAPKDATASTLELLKQEKERAEHVARLKSEFLNQVSHELRTPLAVIIGYIECITDGLYGEIESKHQEILQIVAKQSSHLKNMIDQILIFSRLEANKQPLRIEEFPVSKIFNDLRDTFNFLCKQKGLDIRWEVSTEIATLTTDPERFKEIISNLLQNAIKYTDHGVITARFHYLTRDTVALEVSDTGIGIAHHHISNVFDPFMQVHKTSSENSRGGIGLGLSIVKKHVDQMKGTISVESELGKGTTFKIILPRVYEGRPSATNRLRNLIRLPIAHTGRVRSSPVAASGGQSSEANGAHRAIG
ncbi:MAG TPA: HAMP domain-containing sensor histidine kinase [Candidatus Binatia bacterium]